MENNINDIDDLIEAGEPITTYMSYPTPEQCVKMLEKYPIGSSEHSIGEQVLNMHKAKDSTIDSKPRTAKEIILSDMQEAAKAHDMKTYRSLRLKLKKY